MTPRKYSLAEIKAWFSSCMDDLAPPVKDRIECLIAKIEYNSGDSGRERKWREKNPEKAKAYDKKYREENKDKVKKWREAYRDKHNENRRINRKAKYKSPSSVAEKIKKDELKRTERW